MHNCDCVGHYFYTKRIFKNGTIHFCAQCKSCLRVVKLPIHNFRPWIKPEEIPTGNIIQDFIE